MHFLGLAGMPRRIPDYPEAYHFLNRVCTFGSMISLVSLVIFIAGLHFAFLGDKFIIILPERCAVIAKKILLSIFGQYDTQHYERRKLKCVIVPKYVLLSALFLDRPLNTRLRFQAPATRFMNDVIDFYNDVLGASLFVTVFIMVILFDILVKFSEMRSANTLNSPKFVSTVRHHAMLETL